MTRHEFALNLREAIERKDNDVTNKELEKFLDLNYDEWGCGDWDYDMFTSFSSDLCANDGDFWLTVYEWELNVPEKYRKKYEEEEY